MPTGFTGARRDDLGAAEERLHHHRGAPFDGQDRVRPVHRASRRRDGEIPHRHILARNVQGRSSRSACCAREARINMHLLRSGKLPQRDCRKSFARRRTRFRRRRCSSTTRPALRCLELRAKARRLKAQHNLDLVIVDYLQLMGSSGKVENRQQEISQISRSLKGHCQRARCAAHRAFAALARARAARRQPPPAAFRFA